MVLLSGVRTGFRFSTGQILGDDLARDHLHACFMLVFHQPVAHADEINARVGLVDRRLEHVLVEGIGGRQVDVGRLVRALVPRAGRANARALAHASQCRVLVLAAAEADVVLTAPRDVFHRQRCALLLG
ncbi:MAG: hypothetical protein R3E65_11750 [Steroidobacteraceae bacterium]